MGSLCSTWKRFLRMWDLRLSRGWFFHPIGPRVNELRTREVQRGFNRLRGVSTFTDRSKRQSVKLLEFLIRAK